MAFILSFYNNLWIYMMTEVNTTLRLHFCNSHRYWRQSDVISPTSGSRVHTEVHHYLHKSQQLDPSLSHMNTIQPSHPISIRLIFTLSSHCVYFTHVSYSLQVSWPKFIMHFSSPPCVLTRCCLLTPIVNICNAMRRTTVEQKCGGGTWHIRAAVAEGIHSPTPVDVVSPTIRAWNKGK